MINHDMQDLSATKESSPEPKHLDVQAEMMEHKHA